jgi:hypothetical protein
MKAETANTTSVADTLTRAPKMSRTQLLEAIAGMFQVHPALEFRTVPRIEYLEMAELRATRSDGTMFAPIVTRLNMLCVPTEPNLGAIMDNLELTEGDMHDLGCACLGDTVNGATIEGRVKRLVTFGLPA